MGKSEMHPELLDALDRLGSQSEVERVAGVLASWSSESQLKLIRLLGQARTSLQREVILRSAAAGHSLDPVSAFGHAIRGLSDKALHRAYGGSEEDPLGNYLRKGNQLPKAPPDSHREASIPEDDDRTDLEGSTWRGKPRK